MLAGLSPAAELDRSRVVLEEHDIPCGPLPAKHETHAATLTETRDGAMLAAWFGGTGENDANVKIWLSRKEADEEAWEEPSIVDTGNRMIDGVEKEFACWNPVLFTHPSDGTVYLYYKITGLTEDKGYRNWWGAVKTSDDGGKTWSNRIWLPEIPAEGRSDAFDPYAGRAAGPVKNRPLVLPDGSLLCGSSTESDSQGWRLHFELYQGGDWTGQKHGVKIIGPMVRGMKGIQPSFLVHDRKTMKKLQVLTREDGTAWSEDGGLSWTEVTKGPIDTSKGLHAVSDRNSDWHFLAFNPTGRTPLSLARSRDGKSWETVVTELSKDGKGKMDYPSMMQTRDGKLHVVHSWHRSHIRHLVLDAAYLAKK
ncbi:MAG: sialidase family protein [Verrucomicrobiota bacterium]